MSTQSEHDRRAEIHTRTESATAGPWHEPHDDTDLCVTIGDYGWITPAVPGPAYDVDTEQGRADAEFIAHSRTDVPWLLDLAAEKDTALEEAGWELAAAQMERDGEKTERDRLAADLAEARIEIDELTHRAETAETELRSLADSDVAWHKEVMQQDQFTHRHVARLERRCRDAEAQRDRLAAAIQRARDLPEIPARASDPEAAQTRGTGYNRALADVRAALDGGVPDGG